MDSNPKAQSNELPHRRRTLFLVSILAVVFAGFLGFYNSLDGEFVFDDDACLKSIKTKSPSALLEHIKNNFAFRSIVYASYNLDYQLSEKIGGEYDVTPQQFHRTNLFIHLLTSVGVLFLVFLLIRELEPGEEGWRKALLGGTLAGLIFVSHPLHTEAVSYIAGRSASLSTLFYVWGINWLAWAFRRSVEISSLRRAAHLAGAFLLFLLAFCTRESSISWPLIAFAWISFVTFKNNNWITVFGNRRLQISIAIGIAIIFSLAAYRLTNDRTSHYGAAGQRKAVIESNRNVFTTNTSSQTSTDAKTVQSSSRQSGGKLTWVLDNFFPKGDMNIQNYEFGRFQQMYVYTQTNAINFWSKFVFSAGQCADYHFIPRTVVFSAHFILGVGATLLMLAGVFLLKRKRPAVAFFYFWLLFSSIIFAFGKWENDPLAEKKAYLVGVACSGLVGFYLMEIMSRSRRFFIVGAAATLVIVATLLVLTHERNKVWSSGVTLWEDVLSKAPRNARAKINYGVAISQRATFGEYEEAASDRLLTELFDVYNNSKVLRPEVVSRLARELDRRQRRPEALAILEKTIKDCGDKPGMDQVYFAIGEIYFSMETNFEERRNKDRLGRMYLEKALTLNYRNDAARQLLSNYYYFFSSDQNAQEYEGIVSPEDRIKYLETGIGYFKYMERYYSGSYDDIMREFAPKYIAGMEEKLKELKEASPKP